MEVAGEAGHVYRDLSDGEQLRLWQIRPLSEDPSPALVLFFGGGWATGSPTQFIELGKHLAERGISTVLADYRVHLRHQSTVADSLCDARHAVSWARSNSSTLGIDPLRIGVGGGSAGAYLAAMCAMPWLSGTIGPAEEAVPDALVLFNPPIDLRGITAQTLTPSVLAAVSGIDEAELSPAASVRGGMPPTLILHGLDDELVPFSAIEQFVATSTRLGNRCELVGFDGQGHGFFNHPSFSRRANGVGYSATLPSVDAFLDSVWAP